ncbi:MAG TPA: redoxin domain-containing protein [Saprospiraceae bacterium]|nr:redoxin domain-containing protein [Saprospiraceae bacterium]
MQRIYLLLAFFICTISAFAQNGYQIKVDIEGYNQENLYLGYYYGDKTLIQDTTQVDTDGTFTFSGDNPLAPGMYLVVLAPDNNFFQLLIEEDEQQFQIKTQKDQLTEAIQFSGSPTNKLFYDYLAFLGSVRPKAQAISQEMQEAGEQRKATLQNDLDKINQQVVDYQQNILQQHPESFTALIIRSNQGVETPDFSGTEEEKQMQSWYYTRRHFFDNIDLGDPRLLRTPFLFERINTYIEKLHYQTPDSTIQAIDNVLAQLEPSEESYKYYLIQFLNKYASSKIVGQDAIYVHLALNYYAKGKASWVEEEQLNKIVEDASKLEPLLIGKIAPDVKLQKRDGSKISLYEVDSEYTVLYFWRYDCGHCKESTPFMRDFYNEFKDKGVKILAVCTKQRDEIAGCWEYVAENEIQNWIHTVDPYGLYMLDYNVKTTPQVYVLDKNKKIVMKKIGAEQLGEVMGRIIEMDKNKAAEANSGE